jgi:hypothetical protein
MTNAMLSELRALRQLHDQIKTSLPFDDLGGLQARDCLHNFHHVG